MSKRKQKPPQEMEQKHNSIFITKVDEALGVVEASVSVFGVIDYGRDIIHPGSFVKTISERKAKIRVVDQHNTDSIFRVIGMPLNMKEVGRSDLPKEVLDKYPSATGGLLTVTQYLLNTPEGLGAFNRIKSGAINEYSIGYEALDFDYGEVEVDGKKVRVRNLRVIKLWEFSPVIWGMNPATVTTDVKSNEDTDKELTADGPVQRLGDYLHGTLYSVFANCASWLYSSGYLSEEEWNELNRSAMDMLETFRAEMPDEVALIPLNQYYMLGDNPQLEGKAGRVLSGSNAKRIRDAVDSLVGVLNAAGVYEEEDEEDEKNLGNEDSNPEEKSGPMSTSPNEERRKQLLSEANSVDRRLKLYGEM